MSKTSKQLNVGDKISFKYNCAWAGATVYHEDHTVIWTSTDTIVPKEDDVFVVIDSNEAHIVVGGTVGDYTYIIRASKADILMMIND